MRVPWVIVGATAVLALNDHVLKQAHPSWVTGKVSDVAGLIVAPWLLARLLQPWGERRAGGWAVGLVGAGFAAVKVLPAVTVAFETVLRALGWTSQVVTDPTDLLALPALVVGARLVGVEARPGGLLVPFALSFGLVASAATSCGAEEPRYATQIDIVDGEVVGVDEVATSRASTSAVDPVDPAREYRLVLGERVEERAGDGSWRTAFEIPSERRMYMERYEHEFESPLQIGGCGDPFDIDGPSPGFSDIAVREVDAGSEVFVAMGNQGLLRRDSDGVWHRERFLDGRPSPTEGGLDGLEWELVLPFPLVAFATIAFAGFGWGIAPPGPVERHRALRTVAVTMGLLLAALLISTASPPGAVVPLVALATWAATRSRVARLAILGGIAVPVIAVVPWILWSAGTIESYEVATTFSVILLSVGFVLSGVELWRIRSRQILEDPL